MTVPVGYVPQPVHERALALPARHRDVHRRGFEPGASSTHFRRPGAGPAPGPLSALPKAASRSDLVAASLREAILDGRLEPGEVLVERKLAELLGVSKTPVREALIALASTGLVTVNASRGAVVRRLSVSDVREIYEMRLLLEPWAVGRTAELRPTDGIAAARAALAEAGQLLGSADQDQLSQVNRRFHRGLYSGCGNRLVVAELDQLQDLTALGTVSVVWRLFSTWRPEYREHQEMLEAVEAGDAQAAQTRAREHIEQNVRKLAEILAAGQDGRPG
jgi:DNA-binding GntR family transcriptional regulator